MQDVKQADFELPTLGPKLVAFRDEAVNGRGFVLLRGLPVEQWPVEEVAIAYWGLATYWGKAQPQNRLHHLLGHVKVGQHTQLVVSLQHFALPCPMMFAVSIEELQYFYTGVLVMHTCAGLAVATQLYADFVPLSSAES